MLYTYCLDSSISISSSMMGAILWICLEKVPDTPPWGFYPETGESGTTVLWAIPCSISLSYSSIFSYRQLKKSCQSSSTSTSYSKRVFPEVSILFFLSRITYFKSSSFCSASICSLDWCSESISLIIAWELLIFSTAFSSFYKATDSKTITTTFLLRGNLILLITELAIDSFLLSI